MELSQIIRTSLIAILITCTVPCASWAKEKDTKGRLITLRDFGADDLAYLSLPQSAPQYGVLILHDRHGLTDEIKRLADSIAKRGQIAIAIDLYNGQPVSNEESASLMQSNIRPEMATSTIQAALTLLAESPQWKTPQSVILALGEQAPLALQIDWKKNPTLSGMSWVEPSGELNPRSLRRCPLPLQLVTVNQRQQDFMKKFDGQIEEKRQTMTFKQSFKQENLWHDSNPENQRFIKLLTAFWGDCAGGKHTARRSTFERWVNSIVD